MADVESNAEEHISDFQSKINSFSFLLVGKDKSLGRDVARLAALGIIARTTGDQEDASGSPLKPNDPKYAAWKARKHEAYGVGNLTGQMLGLESVLGKVTITDDEIEMIYGLDKKPQKYAGKGTISGDEPTDREKAQWFEASGREFYALDDEISDAIREECSHALDEHLEKS